MSLTPRGMSVQEAYRLFAEGNFVVNRRYQRKLVWSEEENGISLTLSRRDSPYLFSCLRKRRSTTPILK